METSFNFAPIFMFLIVCLLLFLVHNLSGLLSSLKIFSKHGKDLTEQFLDKFPLVLSGFINKSVKEQNIENNQEIHEINKRLERLEAEYHDIRENILSKLDILTKRIEK